MRARFLTLILGALVTWQMAGPVLADHHRRGYGDWRKGAQIHRQWAPGPAFERRVQNQRGQGSAHQRARDAVQSGRIQPLQNVLAMVKRRFPGRVLDADLRDRGGTPVYSVKMLTPDGKVLSVSVDARNGRILGVRGGGR